MARAIQIEPVLAPAADVKGAIILTALAGLYELVKGGADMAVHQYMVEVYAELVKMERLPIADVPDNYRLPVAEYLAGKEN